MSSSDIEVTPDTVTQGGLQAAVYRLMSAWRTFDSVRDSQPVVRSERVTKPAPGPRTPTNVAAIDTEMEAERALRAAVVAACSSMSVPKPSRSIPGTVVGLLASRPFWGELSDEEIRYLWSSLSSAASILDGFSRQHTEAPKTTQPRLFDWQVVAMLQGLGYRVTCPQLRQWRTRSVQARLAGEDCPVITAEKRGRKNVYLLAEVLAYMQWKGCST